MIMLSRRTIAALAVVLGVLFGGAAPASATSDEDLAQAVRTGGLAGRG